MPTDPIPQQYEQPRYEQPQYPTGSDVWSQQPTVAHGGQYAPPMMAPVPQRNRAGMLVIIFVAVLVLGGGGVYAGFYFVKNRGSNTPTTTQTDLQSVQVGDCLINVGTDTDPDMRRSACTAANSFKAVKVARGDGVPRDSSGVVDPKAAAGVVCAGTKYENFYAYWDTEAPAQNVVICLVANVGTATSPTAAS